MTAYKVTFTVEPKELFYYFTTVEAANSFGSKIMTQNPSVYTYKIEEVTDYEADNVGDYPSYNKVKKEG